MNSPPAATSVAMEFGDAESLAAQLDAVCGALRVVEEENQRLKELQGLTSPKQALALAQSQAQSQSQSQAQAPAAAAPVRPHDEPDAASPSSRPRSDQRPAKELEQIISKQSEHLEQAANEQARFMSQVAELESQMAQMEQAIRMEQANAEMAQATAERERLTAQRERATAQHWQTQAIRVRIELRQLATAAAENSGSDRANAGPAAQKKGLRGASEWRQRSMSLSRQLEESVDQLTELQTLNDRQEEEIDQLIRERDSLNVLVQRLKRKQSRDLAVESEEVLLKLFHTLSRAQCRHLAVLLEHRLGSDDDDDDDDDDGDGVPFSSDATTQTDGISVADGLTVVPLDTATAFSPLAAKLMLDPNSPSRRRLTAMGSLQRLSLASSPRQQQKRGRRKTSVSDAAAAAATPATMAVVSNGLPVPMTAALEKADTLRDADDDEDEDDGDPLVHVADSAWLPPTYPDSRYFWLPLLRADAFGLQPEAAEGFLEIDTSLHFTSFHTAVDALNTSETLNSDVV